MKAAFVSLIPYDLINSIYKKVPIYKKVLYVLGVDAKILKLSET